LKAIHQRRKGNVPVFLRAERSLIFQEIARLKKMERVKQHANYGFAIFSFFVEESME
jgi:hypothetical protein